MGEITGKHVIRFVTGQPLGEPKTNATAFRRADRITHPSGRASKWAHHSHARRAAVRLSTLATAAGATAGYITHPGATEATAGVVAAGAVAEGARRTRRAVQGRTHYRQWVRPLHLALAASAALTPLGITPNTRPETYLSVPVDYSTNDEAEIRMELPEGFSGGPMKAEIVRIIREKLGLPDTVVVWRVAGNQPYLTVRIAPQPPERVKWSDALHLIEAAPESAPIVGLTTGGKPVSIDLDAEAPHALVSASSGGGKSVIIRVIASQLMHNGAHMIVLDAKRHSHRWARGLENVTYCRSTEEIHDALVWAATEGERRNVLVDEGGDGATAELPRIIIVAEEMNATISRLQRYWESVRGKEDPKPSPAVTALGEVLFMGRAVRMNVLAVAQMMTARTLGGPEARENFAVRILARYTRNAWNMLVPEIQPMPRASRHAGRVQVCIAGVATPTQVLFPSEREAQEWAAGGVGKFGGGDRVPTSQDVSGAVSQGEETPSVLGRGGLRLVPDLVEPPELAGISLTQAVADGVVSVSLAAVRKASNRDPEFPAPVRREGSSNLYDPAELVAWQRNRPRAVGE